MKNSNNDSDKSGNNFRNSISKISRSNNSVNLSKEEIIVRRLSEKLGKSRQEIQKMISEDLLSILAIVPFSKSK
jgi:hypothetical protein